MDDQIEQQGIYEAETLKLSQTEPPLTLSSVNTSIERLHSTVPLLWVLIVERIRSTLLSLGHLSFFIILKK